MMLAPVWDKVFLGALAGGAGSDVVASGEADVVVEAVVDEDVGVVVGS